MHLALFFSCAWVFVTAAAPLQGTKASASNNNSTAGYTFGVPYIEATYDYVIVGGGTAGLTLATRLAENSSLSVAVVEAGGFYEADNGNISTTPGYDFFFSGTNPNDTNPKVDWSFVTEPQAVNSPINEYSSSSTRLIVSRAPMDEDCIMHEVRHWEGLQQGITYVISGKTPHKKMNTTENCALIETVQQYHQCKGGPTK